MLKTSIRHKTSDGVEHVFTWGRGAAPLRHLFATGVDMPRSACERGYCGDCGISRDAKGKQCKYCLKIEASKA